MKLLLLIAVTLPQVCYTWVDRFGDETSCQKANVVQIGHTRFSSRFKITAPPRRNGAVGCRVYTDYHLIGTLTVEDYCAGFFIDGKLVDDGKQPDLVLRYEGKIK